MKYFEVDDIFRNNEETIRNRFFTGEPTPTTEWIRHRPGEILEAEARPRSQSKRDPLDIVRQCLSVCLDAVYQEGGNITGCYSYGNLNFTFDDEFANRPIVDKLSFETYCLWRIATQTVYNPEAIFFAPKYTLGLIEKESDIGRTSDIGRAIVYFLSRKLREDYRSENGRWVSSQKNSDGHRYFALQMFCRDVCTFLIYLAEYADNYNRLLNCNRWSTLNGTLDTTVFANQDFLSKLYNRMMETRLEG